jgi:hypothetical protein
MDFSNLLGPQSTTPGLEATLLTQTLVVKVKCEPLRGLQDYPGLLSCLVPACLPLALALSCPSGFWFPVLRC